MRGSHPRTHTARGCLRVGEKGAQLLGRGLWVTALLVLLLLLLLLLLLVLLVPELWLWLLLLLLLLPMGNTRHGGIHAIATASSEGKRHGEVVAKEGGGYEQPRCPPRHPTSTSTTSTHSSTGSHVRGGCESGVGG